MQKRLAALLSCSLLFLLGFSGCCDTSCKKKSPAPASAKAKTKTLSKKTTKVAALYNQLEDTTTPLPEISNEAFDRLTYFDEQKISDFDVTQIAYDTNPLNVFDEDNKKELSEDIEKLVTLWKAQDDETKTFEVDFTALYLDTDKSIVAPTTDAPETSQIAQASIVPPEEHKIALVDDVPEDDETAVKIAALVKGLDDAGLPDKSILAEDSTTSNQHVLA